MDYNDKNSLIAVSSSITCFFATPFDPKMNATVIVTHMRINPNSSLHARYVVFEYQCVEESKCLLGLQLNSVMPLVDITQGYLLVNLFVVSQ